MQNFSSMSEAQQFSIFKTVFVYSAFIIFAPIASFFGTKYFFFEGLVGTGSMVSNVWSAVIAVIVLHIALGLFIYKAYFVAEKGKPVEKID